MAAIIALTHLAWRSGLELRGTSDADEVRAARAIALCGAFITLVLELQSVSRVGWMAIVHLAACSLQIAVFFIVAWRDIDKKIPRRHVNLIQLTLILSVVLGGAAYLLGKSAHDVAGIEATTAEMEKANADAEKYRNQYHYPDPTEAQNLAQEHVEWASTMGRESAWTNGITSMGLYAVWLTAGFAWYRSRVTRRKP
jgi:hypothetical protein